MPQCNVCPKNCQLQPNQYGACRVRRANTDAVVYANRHHFSALACDPIEKKPLYHYFPGTRITSIGALGCNLSCRGCQNASISQPSQHARQTHVSPEQIIATAKAQNSIGVAYTYTEPIVWYEDVLEIAALAHQNALKNVLVTAANANPHIWQKILACTDAVNIDLKAFDAQTYRDYCGADFATVQRNIVAAAEKCWLEITTLLIEGINDDPDILARQFQWIATEVGPEIPLHLSAFYPAYRLPEHPRTSPQSLYRAAEIAATAGLKYIYVGNIGAPNPTDCPHCKTTLISRRNYAIQIMPDFSGACTRCGNKIAGYFQ